MSGRWVQTGIVALVALSEAAVVTRAARAAEERAPLASFGVHLVDDLTLKWRGSVPEFSTFDAEETPGWNPWGEAEADASLPRQTGRLKLGLGVGRLGLHIDSHTIVEGTAARVRVKLGLDLGAGRLTLRLPDVKVTPRFDKGQVGFDWFVPIVEERF